VGRVSDRDLSQLYANAEALLVPGEEDFGIASVEAQACGTPVIAVGRGGSCETVIDGLTGILYQDSSEKGIINAIKDV